MNSRLNNLDDLIINQGYMSERTKSPRKMTPHQFYENNVNEMQINKINSGRDMSPNNKIVAKNKPLLNNNANRDMQQYGQGHYNNGSQMNKMPFGQHNSNISANNYSTLQHGYPSNQQQGANPSWRNAKSPRTPHEVKGSQLMNMGMGLNMNNNNNMRQCYNHGSKKAEYMAETDG